MDEPIQILDPALAPIDLLIEDLLAIDADLSAAVEQAMPQIERVNPDFRRSAINLVQYLALRSHDIRSIQGALGDLGLSSLGRSEAHVQASVRSVLALLHTMVGRPWTPLPAPEPPVGLHEGDALLDRHTEALLGPARPDRHVRIMVTASTELADDTGLMRDMVREGMDVLRINCAHDTPEVWSRMVANLRQAEHDTGSQCRVIMDLAGPKLRTGPVQPGPAVVKWRPRRDPSGNMIEPARIWLAPAGVPAPLPATATLPMPEAWLAHLKARDAVRFIDTRGAKRWLTIVEAEGDGWWATSRQTAYVAAGTVLSVARPDVLRGEVGQVPGRPGFLTLHIGDHLLLTRSMEPGRPAHFHALGVERPARIGCTLPEVFASARAGEQIWFDDGKIGGRIVEVNPDALLVEITRAQANGSRLRGEKGINLPETDLNLPALTEMDLAELPFVAATADMIDFSYVGDADDVALLHQKLDELEVERPGIVLKIETRRAFERLPELILEAMREPSAGIMIARGDLAVEVGYERLAEVQEEILWIAEAAHLPVIWATQVLETLAQTGLPSRSEITDAAMGERAESVMLNKGPHIVEAIRVLNSILRRMESHQSKKVSLLRRLRAWTPNEPLPA